VNGSGPGLRVEAAAATDVGLVREGNEDSFYRGTTVFAVADGMGGHVAGEIASSTALEPIASVNETQFATGDDAQDALVEAITAANSEVIAQGDADPSLSGMGTTLTAVLIRSGRLHVAHVGDSRAYLLRDGQGITQLTTDHTLVEQLVRDGRISREQAAIHPQRSVVTRAIGVDRHVDVDSLPPLELQPGDQVLLCSDGLTGPVSDEHIAAILVERDDAREACEALIEAAKAGGAPDNVTVVLLRVEGRGTSRSSAGLRSVDGNSSTGPLPPPVRVRSGGASPAAGAAAAPSDAGDDEGSRRRRSKRPLVVLLVVLLLLGIAGGGAYALLSRAYFVGDDDGRVAIFNGLPQHLLGLPLGWVRETSDLTTDDLPPIQAGRVRDGVTAASLTEARETVERFRERAAVEQGDDEPTEPTPRPSPSPGPSPAPAATPSPAP
jgi:PPM family protein phosphatase